MDRSTPFKSLATLPGSMSQGNGEAETAVGTIKSLLKMGGDPYRALLIYRTTPLEVGYSPSQLMLGCVLQTTVSTTRAQGKPQIPDRTSL